MRKIYVKLTWKIIGINKINKAINILIYNNVSFNCTVMNYNKRPHYEIYVELNYIISKINKDYDLIVDQLKDLCVQE